MDVPAQQVAKQTATYLNVIRFIDEELCEFKKMNPLNVNLIKIADNAHFAFFENYIESVVQLEKYKSKKLSNPIQSLPILVHEYTHSVFSMNIADHSKVIFKIKQAEIKRNQLKLLETKLEHDYENESDEKKQEQISDHGVKVGKEIDKITLFLNTGIFSAIRIIDEYFADVVAVVSTKNPRAMYNPLNTEGKDDIQDSILIRDFTQNYGANILAQWQSNMNLLKVKFFQGKVFYYGLAPLRSYTWELIKGPVMNQANHQKILKIIFMTLADDFDRRFNKEIEFRDIDFKKWNIELRNQIQKNLTDAGLI